MASGVAASPGVAEGIVVPYSELAKAIDEGRRNLVVVGPMIPPEQISIHESVCGLVTQEGGILCHAASIARERGIPCVVGLGDAIRTLTTGMSVVVNGSTGEIYAADN